MTAPNTYSDIRRSGKLTHHSGRGTMPRNAGNFTRGSQLITHKFMMSLSSAKLPVMVWAILFAIVFSIALAMKLREYEIQMILMKIYAAGWMFVENVQQDHQPDRRVRRSHSSPGPHDLQPP